MPGFLITISWVVRGIPYNLPIPAYHTDTILIDFHFKPCEFVRAINIAVSIFFLASRGSNHFIIGDVMRDDGIADYHGRVFQIKGNFIGILQIIRQLFLKIVTYSLES